MRDFLTTFHPLLTIGQMKIKARDQAEMAHCRLKRYDNQEVLWIQTAHVVSTCICEVCGEQIRINMDTHEITVPLSCEV